MTRQLRRIVTSACALLTVIVADPAWADGIRDRQWFLASLRIPEAHQISRGQGVTVAVVDSGVDARHIDLTGNVLSGADFTNAKGGNGWTDQDGHGTAIASLIAGHGHGKDQADGALGVAPAAKLLPVRRIVTGYLETEETSRGIQWATKHGASVINLSLSGAETPVLRRAVEYALAEDVVVIAAVGLPGGLDKVEAPARIPGVVAVSGVDKAGNVVASVSGPEVVVAAPAEDITHATKDGGYATGTGTSDATAIVSGVVALIRARYPELDAANVINRLIMTADDKGPPGRDEHYGYGIVNPVRALTEDVPLVDRNPLLGAPASASTSATTFSSAGTATPQAAEPGSSGRWILAGALVAGAVVVSGAVVAVLLARRRSRVTARW